MAEPYTNYLMWMKSTQYNISSSWEEASASAFAWPPRSSYSCNFCKREFRCAQALGGHMNVHRRDRAKLKQSTQLSPHAPPNSRVSANILGISTSSKITFQRLNRTKEENPMMVNHYQDATNLKTKLSLDSSRNRDETIISKRQRTRQDEEALKIKVSSVEEGIDLELRLAVKY